MTIFNALVINNNDRYCNAVIKSFNNRGSNNFNDRQLPSLITVNDQFLIYNEKVFSC